MEENQEPQPNKAADNRQPDGKFGPGNNANPAGRPKGQSLKEFWKQRLANMTEEEKLAFSADITKDTVWKMGEGLPKADIDLKGEFTSKVIKLDE